MERSIEASTELNVSFDRARSVLLADAAGTVEPVAFTGMVIEVEPPRESSHDDPVIVPLWWRATGFERLFPVFEGALELVAVPDDPVHDDAVHGDAVHDDAVHDDAVHDDAVHAGTTAEPRACLQLRGRYMVPLGAMGRFGDGVVGRRVARRTAASLIEAIAERIAERAGRNDAQREASEPRPAHTMVRDRGSDQWPTKVP